MENYKLIFIAQLSDIMTLLITMNLDLAQVRRRVKLEYFMKILHLVALNIYKLKKLWVILSRL